ncbi:MAG TPA: CAP domain-containing protein, partial [Planctomycetota bacterium]|nr:CAP domain-containing protein [Planctomycetota bacterium]
MLRAFRRSSLLASWILAFALAACGGSDEFALAEARQSIAKGEFEQASAALEGATGSEAAALREEIAEGTKHREELSRELKQLVEEAPKHPPQWSRDQFVDRMKAERDPQSLKLLQEAQSQVARRELEAWRKSVRGTGRPAAAANASGMLVDEDGVLVDAPLSGGAALAAARARETAKQWGSALALAKTAQQDSTVAAAARALEASVLKSARDDADAVLQRARELEAAGAVVEGAHFMSVELARFPMLEEFASLRYESELLTERANAAAPAAVGARGPVPPRAGAANGRDAELARAESPDECAALAVWRVKAGELTSARDAWLEAARRRSTPSWKEECERSARNLDWRIALRDELRDYARVDAETARVLGAEPSGDFTEKRFLGVPIADLGRLIERNPVSSKARLGWLVESIVRGEEGERESATVRLGTLVERREIDAADASSLVAQAKGEVGEGGWTFRGGRWVEGKLAKADAASEARASQSARNAALIGEFCRSTGGQRDAALEAIRALGEPELLEQALAQRWQDGWDRLEKNPNLRQIAGLADDRRALDEARKKALDLIFDEERYFYPYDPPACPPQKAAKYASVQREVDELVQAVHAIWESKKRVKIGDTLREQIEDALWTSSQAAKAGLAIAKIAETWRFATVLPAGDDVGLSDFAWNAAERSALDESERIEARNERLWAALAHAEPADSVPSTDEQRQVRITNAYRHMLGRRALAWNPRLEAAAQGHSDHMANSGDFAHEEQGDPARRTPTDRAKLAGYPGGASENISMGRGDPQSAHEGWTHSSGHHRNLLMQSHREMASA